MSELLIDKLVVSIGCGLSLYVYFGRKGLPASIIAVVIAWMFQNIAIGIGGGMLALFLILNIIRKTESSQEEKMEQDVIDVEFTVLGADQWKKSEQPVGKQ